MEAFSQSEMGKSNITHFTTGVGGSYANVRDQAHSPLLYNGVGGNVQLGHTRNTFHSFSQSFARFDLNLLNAEQSGATIFSYRLEGHYQYYFKQFSNTQKRLRFYPGLAVVAKWALRDHDSFSNNSQVIETRFSLAPAIKIEFPFVLFNRDFELGIFSQLPLLNYIGRPLFASTKFPDQVANEDTAWHNYLTGGDVYSLGSYVNIKTQTYFTYTFKNGNGLKLDYFWSFESLKDKNPVELGEHALVISTLLKL